MNRLGITEIELKQIIKNKSSKLLDIKYIISHLASAEQIDNDFNIKWMKTRQSIRIFEQIYIHLNSKFGPDVSVILDHSSAKKSIFLEVCVFIKLRRQLRVYYDQN